MRRLQWGMIGLGRMGESFAAALPADQTLAGVAAHDPARAAAFAAKFGHPRVYPTYAALFADPAIDVVYIATTHNFHYANIKAALLAGKHVLAEKSITLNASELRELVDLAQARHLILMEAQTIYHMPLYPALLTAAESLGTLRGMQISFGINPKLPASDRLLNPALAGGALLDIGVYALSFARRLLGGPLTLVATQMRRMATGADDQSQTLLAGPNGEQITVALSLQGQLPNHGVVAYANGYLDVADYGRADTASIVRPGQPDQGCHAGDTAQALAYEVADMVTAIDTGENSTLAWTQDVMATMTAMRMAWDYWYPTEQH
ncbi:Gfo/Idh/MocA family protein [Lacticaseibacillus nasuensis]|uniref:Gfo/Idh/MocA family protein n=1 Tax=Lacticaseibacillus nasuensis TaxID=944671 RepID=UPI002247FC54|nr:Gfo/Idh/MocA family oxidoreductase [Lacticaseibacillus nasuensis]MCX2455891.1 Gfo/Idh/MocA family oxidoreductase [Lacticaseibacillus nasuensis]